MKKVIFNFPDVRPADGEQIFVHYEKDERKENVGYDVFKYHKLRDCICNLNGDTFFWDKVKGWMSNSDWKTILSEQYFEPIEEDTGKYAWLSRISKKKRIELLTALRECREGIEKMLLDTELPVCVETCGYEITVFDLQDFSEVEERLAE